MPENESGPPPRLKRLIRRSVPHYVQNYYTHPEDPTRKYDFYDANGENYLDYLVDVPSDDRPIEERIDEADSPLFPDNWADINVLRFARGCLKTWSCSAVMGWAIDVFPTLECGVTAPREDQVDEVIDRFLERVEESGMDEFRTRDNRSHQKFRNTVVSDGETHTAYSSVKTRTGFGEGDAFRGIHGHVGVMDESQDIGEGTFANFKQAIDREIPDVDYFPTMFIIGTPKMTGTFFHKLSNYAETRSWDDKKSVWEVKDNGREFLTPDQESLKAELEEQLEELQDAEEDYEEEIADVQSRLDDISGFTVREWHIDQYNCPLHDDASIAFDKEQLSEKEFQNEVLAKFWTSEDDLLSTDDVYKIGFLNNEGFRQTPLGTGKRVLGVDWGGGKGEGAGSTVIGAFEVVEDTRLHALNVDVLNSSMDPDEEVEQINEWMQRYDIDIGVVDEGYGDTQRHTLQTEYGHTNLYGCRYGNVKDKENIKWNRFEGDKRFFTCNKSYMVKKFVQDFKDGNVDIPKADLSFAGRNDAGTVIVDHLTAPYTERRETPSGQKKVVVQSDRNDDVFDMFTYAWIAANYVGNNNRVVRSASSNMRPGYN